MLKDRFDEERKGADYKRLFVNKGWKSMGDKRGYVDKHDENGVWVRPYLQESWRRGESCFVPWKDIRTVQVGDYKLLDFVDERTSWYSDWHASNPGCTF